MADGVIKLSILNFLTIGIIAFVFVWIVNFALSKTGLTAFTTTPSSSAGGTAAGG